MPWSWGGAARGGVQGVQALVDLLQENQAAARRAAIDAENKKQLEIGNKRQTIQDRLSATEHLGALNDQGGYAEDAVSTPVSRTPGVAAMPSVGNVSRGTSENATTTTASRRPLALADLLSGDSNIGVDPTQSRSAVQQRTAGAALARFTQTKSPADRAAALAAGVTPSQLDEIQPKPAASPVYDTRKPWEKENYATEAEWNAASGRHAAATRAPSTEHRSPAVYTDDLTGKQVQGSFDTQSGTYYDSQGKPRQAAPKGASGSGGSSGQGQVLQARILEAVTMGQTATLPSMRDFEERHFKDGKLDYGGFMGLGAGLANVATSTQGGTLHELLSPAAAKNSDQDVLNYIRQSHEAARLQMLMSARGGSEAQVAQTAKLFMAPPGASDAIVRNARQARESAFGKMGAIMQVLTPEQLVKFHAAVNALKGGESGVDLGKVGAEIFGPGGADGLLLQHGIDPNTLKPLATPGAGGRTGTAPTNAAKPPTGTPASQAQALWDAAVKLHGQAKVLQEYGPRPPN